VRVNAERSNVLGPGAGIRTASPKLRESAAGTRATPSPLIHDPTPNHASGLESLSCGISPRPGFGTDERRRLRRTATAVPRGPQCGSPVVRRHRKTAAALGPSRSRSHEHGGRSTCEDLPRRPSSMDCWDSQVDVAIRPHRPLADTWGFASCGLEDRISIALPWCRGLHCPLFWTAFTGAVSSGLNGQISAPKKESAKSLAVKTSN